MAPPASIWTEGCITAGALYVAYFVHRSECLPPHARLAGVALSLVAAGMHAMRIPRAMRCARRGVWGCGPAGAGLALVAVGILAVGAKVPTVTWPVVAGLAAAQYLVQNAGHLAAHDPARPSKWFEMAVDLPAIAALGIFIGLTVGYCGPTRFLAPLVADLAFHLTEPIVEKYANTRRLAATTDPAKGDEGKRWRENRVSTRPGP